jgi:phage/plasmid-associated DNA primase
MHIHNGRDYLTAWIASLIREPFEPLPYLFAFGSQNGGKSIFHEAIEEALITKGVVRADRALSGHNDFNGELAGAVLCVVEEKNVASSKVSYERMKDWITSRTLSIRKMRTDSYQVPNTTHWVQTTNKQEYCPVFPGDTRITVIAVPDLLPEQIIPKKKLLQLLKDEAPHFLRTLLDWPLPEPEDRLRLPVVVTSSKIKSEEMQRSELEQFIDECVFKVPGESIPFKEFYARFLDWLSEEGLDHWPRKRVVSELPATMPIFDKGSNLRFIGNVSFSNVKSTKPPIVASNRKQIGGEQ